jgi:hypothetical protein
MSNQLIPFWSLDFGFWMVKDLLDKVLDIPAVAIIFLSWYDL